MTVSQKAALSLLIAVFLFAGVAVLAYTGLFDLVESKFYNPSILRSLNRETDGDAKIIEDFLTELDSRFSSSLNNTSVRRSFLPNQSASDIFERSRIYGTLLESVSGLQSVRFVDYAGVRIHFSTYNSDILNQDRLSAAYRNYTDDPRNLPFETVQVPSQGPAQSSAAVKLTLDNSQDRIIFSYPFQDSMDVYRGTALFTVSVRAVAERLISQGRIKAGEDVSVIASPPGIVSGAPNSIKTDIIEQTASIWRDGILSLTSLDAASEAASLTLISAKTEQGIFYGQLFNKEVFSFPQPMKVILLLSIFLTIYLAVFLFFNLRQDSMTLVQHRLKSLQISIIEQFYDRKSDMDWTHWTRELEQRREEIRSEVKRGIRSDQGRRSEENIDSLIDKSWNELLDVIGARRKTETVFDEEKLQGILNRILQTLPAAAAAAQPLATAQPLITTTQPSAMAQPATTAAAQIPQGGDAEAPEEVLEELDDDVDAADSEVLEELVDIEEAEEVDAVEEIEELENLDIAAEAPAAAPVKEKSGGLLAMADQKHGGETPEPADEVIDLANLADSSFTPANNDDDDGVEELEALEELDELAEEADTPSSGSAKGPSEQEILELASKIEFSSDPEPDADEGEELIGDDLEIVSPFASMLSSLEGDELLPADDETDEDDEKKNSAT